MDAKSDAKSPTMNDLVVITGCSSGIGHAIAIAFAKKGYKVIAGARRLGPMEDLVDYGVEIVKLDVTKMEDIQSLKTLIETKYDSKVKYLFNNAGQPCTFPAADVKDEDMIQCYDVNVFGCIRLTRELMDYIINTKGTIGFTGSVSALEPFPFSAIYSSTKAAIHAYANTLAFEMEPFDVKVINIVTGGVKTNIADVRPLYPDSRYQADGIEEVMDRRREMAVRNNPITAEEYSAKVVNDFETSRIGVVNRYRGKMASVFWFALLFIPRFLVLIAFRRRFALDQLWQTLRNVKRKLE